MNREEWLTEFAKRANSYIRSETGLSLPANRLALSCGFPSKGGTRRKNKRIGECHHVGSTGRKIHQMFIHPELNDSVAVGETVMHELLHAMLPAGTGHRKPFSRAAKKIGLEGKPTATYAGEALVERMKVWIEQIGDYPHEALTGSYGPKQQTKMLKVMCPLCGYIIRTTSKWLEEAGAPICPQCNVEMQPADVGEEASDPLHPVDQVIRFKIKHDPASKLKGFDPRWEIQCNRNAKGATWYVIDYGAGIDPATGLLLDPTTGAAVLDAPPPRMTAAPGGRQDAVAIVEAIRTGMMSYEELEERHTEPLDDDSDLFFEDEDEETADFEDQILTEQELLEYEEESAQREGR